jgi:hypothetical protein
MRWLSVFIVINPITNYISDGINGVSLTSSNCVAVHA